MAFASDSSYDTLQLSAQALATNVVARCNLWMRQWEGNAASLLRVVNIPSLNNFQSGFGTLVDRK